MINPTDIHSLSDFQRNTKEFVKQIKESKNPLALTINGKAEIIVQDAEAYQKVLERLEYAESVAAIRKGIEEFHRGEGRPAREALKELRVKHDISR